MVEVYSYAHPRRGWKLPRQRGEDKELGQGCLFEFGTMNTFPISTRCFQNFTQQTFLT